MRLTIAYSTITRLGVPSIAGQLLKVIETCVYDLRHEKGAHCR